MALRTKLAAYFLDLMNGSSSHCWDGLVLGALERASVLYRKGVEKKYRSYADHPERQAWLDAVVISLGNITVGGTGKTPAACMLAQRLQREGYRVALLNRGYRSQKEHDGAVMSDGRQVLLSAAEGGDEACLMARSLPGIPVVIGRERRRSGQIAIEQFGSQVLLLDDGFQHWQLHRDLDIVLVDATNPFGNGKVLPRGILREPMEHLNRAGLFLITKCDQASREAIDAVYSTLQAYNPDAPIAESVHRAKWCISFSDWNGMKGRENCQALPKGTKAVAVSALGNPASFEQTIRSFGYDVVQALRYDDHHHYETDDMAAMKKAADAAGAVLITTEKDAVKLNPEWIRQYDLPLYVLGISLEITRGGEQIDKVLRHVIGG